MSIIIAKIEGNSCSFKSDTKTSILNGDDTVTGGNKLRLNPNEGVLKVHIIHPAICIAFAGGTITPIKIIYELCRQLPKELDEILEFLKEKLLQENDNSEFIVGSYYKQKLELYKIANNKIDNSKTFWIGEKQAFKEFQAYYNSDASKKHLINRFHRSFDELIRHSNIPIIGDFIIGASFNEVHKCFVYEPSLISDSGYGVTKIKAFTPTTISEGTVSEGAFTVTNLVSANIMRPAICLYFSKAKISYLYFPISNMVESASPIVIKNISLKLLKNKVLKKYGINLIGISFNLGKLREVI